MQRPSLRKGGPSPRIRALASHDRLRRRRSAASFSVSKRSLPADFAGIRKVRRLRPAAPLAARARLTPKCRPCHANARCGRLCHGQPTCGPLSSRKAPARQRDGRPPLARLCHAKPGGLPSSDSQNLIEGARSSCIHGLPNISVPPLASRPLRSAEQLQPFPGHAVFVAYETSGIARSAGPRHSCGPTASFPIPIRTHQQNKD